MSSELANLYKAKDWTALVALGEAILHDPEAAIEPKHILWIARAHTQLERPEGAAQVFELALKRFPEMHDFRRRALAIRFTTKDWERVIALSPPLLDDPEAGIEPRFFYWVARAQTQLERPEEALRIYELALERCPEIVDFRKRVLAAKYTQSDWDAVVALGRPLLDDPAAEIEPRHLLWIARAHQQLGQAEAAERLHEFGLRLFPDNVDFRKRLVAARHAGQEWDQVIALGAPLLDSQEAGVEPKFFRMVSDAYVKLGQPEAARRFYHAAVGPEEEFRQQFRQDYSDNFKALRREEISAARRLQKRLNREIEKAGLYRYGSFRPGRADWQQKWDATPGRRVLMYGVRDYGSLYQWAEAVNKHTDFAARVAIIHPHEFDFPIDLLFSYPGLTEHSRLEELVDEADIIHVKDEIGFFVDGRPIAQDFFSRTGKPRIYTAYGGQARKYKEDPAFRVHVMGHDARIALTPDLNYAWFDGALVPQAIDADANPYLWTDGRSLMHSPSTMERKGTSKLLEAIEGMDIDFEMIHGLPYQECIARKRRANLFFDQAGQEIERFLGIVDIIGWYGNAAIEAAVHGIPTIAHLSETALEGAERAGLSGVRTECGILNTPFDVDGIRRCIADYFESTPAERKAASLKSRKWIEDFHSHQAVGRALAKVYSGLT